MSAILFWIFGAAAVASGLVAVTRRNPVYAALFLLVSMGCVGVEFLLLHSPFIAAMQIILYAGAIVVVFVFVIMLLSLKEGELGREPPMVLKAGAGVVALALFALLALPGLRDEGLKSKLTAADAEGQGGGRLRELAVEVRPADVVAVAAARQGLQPAQLARSSQDRSQTAIKDRLKTARGDAAYLGLELCPTRSRGLSAALGTTRTRLGQLHDEVAASLEAAAEGSPVEVRVAALRERALLKAQRYGSLEEFVGFLYSRYVVAFELVSLLIFAAIAGVVVLARRRGFMGLEGAPGSEAGPQGGFLL